MPDLDTLARELVRKDMVRARDDMILMGPERAAEKLAKEASDYTYFAELDSPEGVRALRSVLRDL